MQLTNKLSLFEEELNWIPNADVKMWVSNCLEEAPGYFWEVSSSDSNSYHPYWDLGPGGTVVHSKAVTAVGKMLFDTYCVRKENDAAVYDYRLSHVLAACILHDSCKYGLSFDLRMYPLHPYLPRLLFKDVGGIPEDRKVWIFRYIESHMGSLNTGGWDVLPHITHENLQDNDLASIVHLADFLASRNEYVDRRFIDRNKDIDTSTFKPYENFPDYILKGLVLGIVMDKISKEEFLKEFTEGDLIENLFCRVKGLRSPYRERRVSYNLDGIISNIEKNYEILSGGK